MTGVIGKGDYQNTWDGDWHNERYDDYAVLCAKLAPTCTKLDVTNTARWEEDWDAIRNKCPDIEIITEKANAIAGHRALPQTHSAETYILTGLRTTVSTKGIVVMDGKMIVK